MCLLECVWNISISLDHRLVGIAYKSELVSFWYAYLHWEIFALMYIDFTFFFSLLFLAMFSPINCYDCLARIISNHELKSSTHTHIRATWIGSTCEQNKNWPNGENDEIYLISVSLITCPFSIRNNNWLTVTEYLSFFLCFFFRVFVMLN